MAAIFAALLSGAKPPLEAPSKRDGMKPYNHWVVINGPVKDAGKFFEIPIWTWGEQYTVKVGKKVAHTYIRALVSGKLAMK